MKAVIDELHQIGQANQQPTPVKNKTPGIWKTDTTILNWWEAHPHCTTDLDYETGEVIILENVGNINDRSYKELSRAATFREAISKLL